MQGGQRRLAILQEKRFGNLELEPARLDARGRERAHDELRQVSGVELDGRQIDRHLDVARPFRRFRQRLAQRPLAHGHDEPGLLGKRDELAWRDHVALRGAPAHQRLEARKLVALQVQERLVVELELPVGEGSTQVPLELVAGAHASVHLVFEEPVPAPLLLLRAIEREVGVLEELVGVRPVARRHRNADADAEHDLEPLPEHEGLVHHGDDLPGEVAGVGRRERGILHDDELVAAHARERVDLTHGTLQARRDPLQELVADRVTERVVDLLEAIEIEAMHRKSFARTQARERLLQSLAHQHAIGQIGEPVVAREVLDLRLRLAPLGDVLVRTDPAAAGHRHVRRRDGAAVVHLLDRVARRVDVRGAIAQILLGGRPAPYADRDAPLDDLAARRPRLHVVGAQTVERRVAIVADDDPLLLVVHAQPLRHVHQGGIEQEIARPELLLPL